MKPAQKACLELQGLQRGLAKFTLCCSTPEDALQLLWVVLIDGLHEGSRKPAQQGQVLACYLNEFLHGPTSSLYTFCSFVDPQQAVQNSRRQNIWPRSSACFYECLPQQCTEQAVAFRSKCREVLPVDSQGSHQASCALPAASWPAWGLQQH